MNADRPSGSGNGAGKPLSASETSYEELELRENYTNAAAFGTEEYLKLKISLGKEPAREQWQKEFLYHIQVATDQLHLLDKLWKDVLAASMEYERLQGRKPVAEIVEQMLNRELSKTAPAPPAANIMKTQPSKGSVLPPDHQTNRVRTLCLTALAMFIITCLFPPWAYTVDVTGESGGHSRKPAGFYFITKPPPPQYEQWQSGVQLDLARLAVEWAALAAATAGAWFLIDGPKMKQSKTKLWN